jgi:prolipoprotein diacylglyceryltransferase
MRTVTQLLSAAMVVIGLAILVRTLAEGGPIAVGVLLGLLFMAAGFGRLYLERHR